MDFSSLVDHANKPKPASTAASKSEEKSASAAAASWTLLKGGVSTGLVKELAAVPTHNPAAEIVAQVFARPFGDETLTMLRQAFDIADEDGDGTLNFHEFRYAFGPVLHEMDPVHSSHMFMKIDSDGSGNIDWEEFVNFLLLDRDESGKVEPFDTTIQWVPKRTDHIPRANMHKGVVVKMLALADINRYCTFSTDGWLKLWEPKRLSLVKTVVNGTAAIVDAVYLPRSHRVIVASDDRNIKIHLINPKVSNAGSQQVGCFKRFEHMPTCMCAQIIDEKEYLFIGDERGYVTWFTFDERLWHVCDGSLNCHMRSTMTGLSMGGRKLHNKMVTQVRHDESLSALISTSLDGTLRLSDWNSGETRWTLRCHQRGAYGFDFSVLHGLFVTHGLDRNAYLWAPLTNKPIATLFGHNASLQQVLINEEDHQVITLAKDKVVKVFDLRTHRCIQSFNEVNEQAMGVDTQYSAMFHDSIQKRLYCCAHKAHAFSIKRPPRAGHLAPIVEMIFGQLSEMVVSIDDDSVCCVWSLRSGDLLFTFECFHRDGMREAKVNTAMFDLTGRKLFTAAQDGSLRVWNFNNAKCLKEFKGGSLGDCSSIVYLPCATKELGYPLASVGRGVNVWSDQLALLKNDIHASIPTQEDILSLVVCNAGTVAGGGQDGSIYLFNTASWFLRAVIEIPHAPLSTQPNRRASMNKFVPSAKGSSAQMARGIEKLLLLKTLQTVIVSASTDGFLRFWDFTRLLYLFEAPAFGMSSNVAITSLARTPEDSFLYVGNLQGLVRCFDISGFHPSKEGSQTDRVRRPHEQEHSLIPRFQWRAHPHEPVRNIEYAKDRRVLITASPSGIRMWTRVGGLLSTFGETSWGPSLFVTRGERLEYKTDFNPWTGDVVEPEPPSTTTDDDDDADADKTDEGTAATTTKAEIEFGAPSVTEMGVRFQVPTMQTINAVNKVQGRRAIDTKLANSEAANNTGQTPKTGIDKSINTPKSLNTPKSSAPDSSMTPKAASRSTDTFPTPRSALEIVQSTPRLSGRPPVPSLLGREGSSSVFLTETLLEENPVPVAEPDPPKPKGRTRDLRDLMGDLLPDSLTARAQSVGAKEIINYFLPEPSLASQWHRPSYRNNMYHLQTVPLDTNTAQQRLWRGKVKAAEQSRVQRQRQEALQAQKAPSVRTSPSPSQENTTGPSGGMSISVNKVQIQSTGDPASPMRRSDSRRDLQVASSPMLNRSGSRRELTVPSSPMLNRSGSRRELAVPRRVIVDDSMSPNSPSRMSDSGAAFFQANKAGPTDAVGDAGGGAGGGGSFHSSADGAAGSDSGGGGGGGSLHLRTPRGSGGDLAQRRSPRRPRGGGSFHENPAGAGGGATNQTEAERSPKRLHGGGSFHENPVGGGANPSEPAGGGGSKAGSFTDKTPSGSTVGMKGRFGSMTERVGAPPRTPKGGAVSERGHNHHNNHHNSNSSNNNHHNSNSQDVYDAWEEEFSPVRMRKPPKLLR